MNTCAKLSMMNAAAEVKVLPNYAVSGEMCTFNDPADSIMVAVNTDALHDSTSNAFHATIPCLSGR